jgi:hypothetical protein
MSVHQSHARWTCLLCHAASLDGPSSPASPNQGYNPEPGRTQALDADESQAFSHLLWGYEGNQLAPAFLCCLAPACTMSADEDKAGTWPCRRRKERGEIVPVDFGGETLKADRRERDERNWRRRAQRFSISSDLYRALRHGAHLLLRNGDGRWTLHVACEIRTRAHNLQRFLGIPNPFGTSGTLSLARLAS